MQERQTDTDGHHRVVSRVTLPHPPLGGSHCEVLHGDEEEVEVDEAALRQAEVHEAAVGHHEVPRVLPDLVDAEPAGGVPNRALLGGAEGWGVPPVCKSQASVPAGDLPGPVRRLHWAQERGGGMGGEGPGSAWPSLPAPPPPPPPASVPGRPGRPAGGWGHPEPMPHGRSLRHPTAAAEHRQTWALMGGAETGRAH